MSGVLGDQPGARREPVPGPDGYSGCGLEKPSPYVGLLAAGVITGEQCEQAEQGQKLYEQCFHIMTEEADKQKPEWTKPELHPRSCFPLKAGGFAELSSTEPLTDADRIRIAISLLGRVGK